MDVEIFSRVDAIIKEAQSNDPRTVAEKLGYFFIELSGTIAGYATHYNNLPVIGLHSGLEGEDYMFGGWHELGHVLRGDIWDSALSREGGIHDVVFGTHDVDDVQVPRHEYACNLIAAHATIGTKETLDVIGYNNTTLKQYRRLKKRQNELRSEYEGLLCSIDYRNATLNLKARLQRYKRAMAILEEEKQGLEQELVDMNMCRSISEMAVILGTSERYFRYKLEALRLQKYDISVQELERYDRMFDNVI